MAEEKDFAWLCTLLVGARVAVLETAFLQKNEVCLWVYTSKTGKVKRKSLSEQSDRSPLSALAHFQANRPNPTSPSDSVCTALVKRSRVSIEYAQTDDLSAVVSFLSRIEGLQAVFENPQLHTLRLHWNGADYSSSFTTRRSDGVKQIKSVRLWCKCVSLAKVVLRTVERARRKQVEVLELELFASLDGEVYICGCPRLKLLTAKTVVESTEKAAGKQQRMDYRIRTPLALDAAAISSVSGLSVMSALPSPTESLQSAEVSPKRECFSPTRTSKVSGAVLPRLRRSPTHSIEIANPNFREMLALMYARERPSKRYLDLGTLIRDMDADLQKEDDPKLHPSLITVQRVHSPASKPRPVRALQPRRRSNDVPAPVRPAHHRSVGSFNSILQKYQPAKRLSRLIAQASAASPPRSLASSYHFSLLQS